MAVNIPLFTVRWKCGQGFDIVIGIMIDAEILFRELWERYLFGVIVIGQTERASADDTGTGGGTV